MNTLKTLTLSSFAIITLVISLKSLYESNSAVSIIVAYIVVIVSIINSDRVSGAISHLTNNLRSLKKMNGMNIETLVSEQNIAVMLASVLQNIAGESIPENSALLKGGRYNPVNGLYSIVKQNHLSKTDQIQALLGYEASLQDYATLLYSESQGKKNRPNIFEIISNERNLYRTTGRFSNALHLKLYGVESHENAVNSNATTTPANVPTTAVENTVKTENRTQSHALTMHDSLTLGNNYSPIEARGVNVMPQKLLKDNVTLRCKVTGNTPLLRQGMELTFAGVVARYTIDKIGDTWINLKVKPTLAKTIREQIAPTPTPPLAQPTAAPSIDEIVAAVMKALQK